MQLIAETFRLYAWNAGTFRSMALPDQDELRRRLKAGRALRGLTVADLAERVSPDARLGERTLRKLESGESQITSPLLRELAAALDVPFGFFEAADPVGKPSASLDVAVQILNVVQDHDARLDALAAQVTSHDDWARTHIFQREGAQHISDGVLDAIARIDERQNVLIEALSALLPTDAESLAELQEVLAAAAQLLSEESTPTARTTDATKTTPAEPTQLDSKRSERA